MSAELRYLVTGGHGFIGSHVARELKKRGHYIRIADTSPTCELPGELCDEFFLVDLCDLDQCRRAVRGVGCVLHFAALMGGMGMIHASNEETIYIINHIITFNLLRACNEQGKLSKFFFASSACVYPQILQGKENRDVLLAETDVQHHPITPQGLYGLEKFNSESLVRNFRWKSYSEAPTLYIGRFHNVYGPNGTWFGGREKAPAALLRKAAVAKLVGQTPTMELWGDGSERRSFLYIDDAVDAVMRLLDSKCSDPINIGSERTISIRELASTALKMVNLSGSGVRFAYDHSKDVGVGARSSDNTLVEKVLGWRPRVSLEEGMERTCRSIEAGIEKFLEGLPDEKRKVQLELWKHSEVEDLRSNSISFALLLPMTSRNSSSPNDCLDSLKRFAYSIVDTAWRDTHSYSQTSFKAKIYLGIDSDDDFLLLGSGETKPEAVLRSAGLIDVVLMKFDPCHGRVCDLWRDLARRAWQDRADYFILLGDDVELLDEGWMRKAHQCFLDLATTRGLPHGVGCVAFTDTTFPGMPTFPIIHRYHMDAFDGKVVPEIFVNQDGDPFLFQLYRRFGVNRMMPSRISNRVGGEGLARYSKVSARHWTFQTLDVASDALTKDLAAKALEGARISTIDVIVPSFRVNLSLLDNILGLQSSDTCSVNFIIIIDTPDSPFIDKLLTRHGHRSDVRIRINERNLGASAARNRGLSESAAEWVLFLDDDVIPEPNILWNLERHIRVHPQAAGFVGLSHFPSPSSIFTMALHYSGITYFWDIAEKLEGEIPWGVTANLAARRVNDGSEFDLRFPRTGGGEDVDFCLRRRQASKMTGGVGFLGAPDVIVTHPWWNGGSRSYRRFFGWARGDGALTDMYPSLSYRDAPNSAEILLVASAGTIVGLLGVILPCLSPLRHVSFALIVSVMVANIFHDIFRHLWRERGHIQLPGVQPNGFRWSIAILESSIIRMVSEFGRLVGILERREFTSIFKRFDWFIRLPGRKDKELARTNSAERLILIVLLMAIYLSRC
ncbi:glycosyltransferase family 2 protein [Cantharellus anzutake]|uniref:glycosyltransferase family 2 protein n=1 Tax=Cantharellus anzutake TaxID=1750568 RepID=UPI001904B5CC|nr:glycosyltransferase family 2 protein [Cantharellus anzutake]KAF8317530.1 glycosyltransferase family 2 protein [Cantharellus anzutake]